MVPRLDQLSASGAPTRSGSVTNFAASISGDASAQSSDRGTIHQVLAISASNVPDKPLLFHLATRLLSNEGSAVAPNAPAIASSGIWTSMCATMTRSSASRATGVTRAPKSSAATHARLIGPFPRLPVPLR